MLFIPQILFYVFSVLLLTCAFMTIRMRNPIHSIFSLILAFISASGLLLLLGAEFLAMILIIVYVGAIAVLFLFVIMMLGEVSNEPFKLSKGTGIFFILLVGEFLFICNKWVGYPAEVISYPLKKSSVFIQNIHTLGDILYTVYIIPFQISGLILLVAMIGSITLTLRKRPGVKRQNIKKQIERNGVESITLMHLPLPSDNEKSEE